MKLKKVSCFIMATAMGVSLFAGCSSRSRESVPETPVEAEDAGKGSEEPSKEAEDGEQAPAADTAEETEHYTYTMAMHNFGPWDEEPEMVARWEEEYNADFELVYVESSNAGDSLNLMIASGEKYRTCFSR